METGEVTEYTQKNTQLLGMFKNLSETSTEPYFSSNNTNSMIYISDNNFDLVRQVYSPVTTARTITI
jgi:hypothetical protein